MAAFQEHICNDSIVIWIIKLNNYLRYGMRSQTDMRNVNKRVLYISLYVCVCVCLHSKFFYFAHIMYYLRSTSLSKSLYARIQFQITHISSLFHLNFVSFYDEFMFICSVSFDIFSGSLYSFINLCFTNAWQQTILKVLINKYF